MVHSFAMDEVLWSYLSRHHIRYKTTCVSQLGISLVDQKARFYYHLQAPNLGSTKTRPKVATTYRVHLALFVLLVTIRYLIEMQIGCIYNTKRFTSMVVTLILITSVDFSSELDLNGRLLTFLALDQPPYDNLIRGPNGTFTFTGVNYKLISWMSTKFNFTFRLILINQSLVERYGTHGAAHYQLANQEDVDSITSTFHLTADRVAKNDPTSFIWTEGMKLIVPRPEEENRLFAFIGPFQPLVWLLIFISLFPVIGAMTFFTWLYKHLHWNNDANRYNNSIRWFTTISSSHTIYVINTLTNQGCREAFDRTSFRILTGIWVLCAMVLVNCYTGIVTSSLTTPRMKPTINSFEDLAAGKEVKIVIRSDTTIGDQILKATSGVYKVLGDEARRNPIQIVDNPFKLTARLQTGRYAYPYLHSLCYAFVCSQYEKDGKCRFKLSKLLPVSIGFTSLYFKKGSSFTKDMDKGLMELWESGLVRFWINNIPSTPKAQQCFVDTKRGVTRVVPIQLSDLISAFFILAIGIGLATLSFLLELIHSKFRR